MFTVTCEDLKILVSCYLHRDLTRHSIIPGTKDFALPCVCRIFLATVQSGIYPCITTIHSAAYCISVRKWNAVYSKT